MKLFFKLINVTKHKHTVFDLALERLEFIPEFAIEGGVDHDRYAAEDACVSIMLFGLIAFYTGLRWRTHHAGLNFMFRFFWLEFNFEFRDNRHWNDKAGRWYEDGEEQAEYEKRKKKK